MNYQRGKCIVINGNVMPLLQNSIKQTDVIVNLLFVTI